MINSELEPRILELDTDVVKIFEEIEPIRRLIVESTKRVEKFQIIRSKPRSIFFKVLYESGKSIPELEGSFTSPQLALDTLLRYLATSKPTKEARYKDRWGDKEIPVLKTKKRINKTNAISQPNTTHSG